MEKSKTYPNVRFSSDTLRDALKIFTELIPSEAQIAYSIRSIALEGETWKFDTDEEFFAAYRKPCRNATFGKHASKDKIAVAKLSLAFRHIAVYQSLVTIELADAPKIEEVFEVFERNVKTSRLEVPAPPAPLPVTPTIFIGHGRSMQWRDLKDHLTDKQGYSVSAYEVGARAGHTIRDILQELLVKSSFALLVLTAEDETSTGQLRARQNVVHELGLFQGKLGFPRAIAVVEEGAELLSNLDGIQQLRFNAGNIAAVYGDVIATLRREFGDAR